MRRAYVLISPCIIGYFCKSGKNARTLEIESDVPEDAVFITADYSDSLQAFRVIFEHSSFEDIPEGCRLPMLKNPTATQHFNHVPYWVE